MQDEQLKSDNLRYDNDEIDLMEYLKIIIKHKRFIYYFVSASIALSVLVSLILPKQYKSKALISASSQDSSGSARYLSMLKGLAGGMVDIGGGTNNDKIIGIIKSRSMADFLIEKFNLMEKFNSKIIDNVESAIQSLIKVKATKEGLIEISVEHKDPVLAQELVNACIERLDKMNIGYSIYGASKERIFLEQRLLEVRKNLSDSENKLRDFQEQNKLVELGTQTSSTVATVSELYSKLIEMETQLGVKRKFKSEDDAEVLALKLTIDEIKKQIDLVSKRTPREDTITNDGDLTKNVRVKKGKSKDYLITLDETPELALQYIRLKRDLKVQETLFELLTEQFELAKINEQKNIPTLTIIDRATQPLVKSKPKRKLIVMVATMLSLFSSIFLVFVIEFVKNLKKNIPLKETKGTVSTLILLITSLLLFNIGKSNSADGTYLQRDRNILNNRGQLQPSRQFQQEEESGFGNRQLPNYSISPYGSEAYSSSRQVAQPIVSQTPLEKPIDPAEYILGPGDVLTLAMWGNTNEIISLQVNPEGKIILPKGGFINANDKTIVKVEKLVGGVIQKYYFGIEYSLSMQTPRVFLVSVVGQVKNPGLYYAQATERISEIIFRAGDIDQKGSKNFVQIIRGENIITANLESFVQKGDKDSNPFVRENDVVFVPIKGPSVNIYGEVNLAGSYEIKEGDDIKRLLERTGGLTEKAAYLDEVKIKRIVKNKKEKILIAVKLQDLVDGKSNITLSDGDDIFIPSIDAIQKMVIVRGAVFGSDSLSQKVIQNVIGSSPGAEIEGLYQLGEGERILDVLNRAGGPTPYAKLSESYIIRGENENGQDNKTIQVDLKKLYIDRDNTANIKLVAGDIIVIPSRDYLVHITGEVKAPKSIIYRKELKFNEYLSLASGPTDRASLWRSTLIKKDGKKIPISKYPTIEAGDTIHIPEKIAKFWQDYLTIALSLSSLSFAILAATR